MILLFCIASNQSWLPASPFSSKSFRKVIRIGGKDFDLYLQTVSDDTSGALLIMHANDVGLVRPLKMITEIAISNLPVGDIEIADTILVSTQKGQTGKYEDRLVVIANSEGAVEKRIYPVFYWGSIEMLAHHLADGGRNDRHVIFEVLSRNNSYSGMPQSLAAQCGFLNHSWLKNQILIMDAGDDVAQMHCRQSLREERDSFERKIRPGGEFESNLGLVRQLVRNVVVSFGFVLPADVSLSGKLQEEKPYSTSYPDNHSVVSIERVIDDWENVFCEFRDVWYQRPRIEETVVKEKFKLVQDCTGELSELLELLGRLLKGVELS